MSRHYLCTRKICIITSPVSKSKGKKKIIIYIAYQCSIHPAGHNLSDTEYVNETLYKWVNAERFPTFPKVTRGNINQLFLTNKNLVLAIVEENQLEEVAPDMLEFRDMVESVIKNKRNKYHEYVVTFILDSTLTEELKINCCIQSFSVRLDR